ncbi:MAG: DUF2520 domain-containing protein [Bacteroidetes bacterium]|nr:MAG: DUF2520 domain-containing protein [Bacteroidota bacterium]
MKVVIIGSGNVATVLGKKILAAGHEILQVMSPNLAHARTLGDILFCEVTNDFNNVHAGGELYLFALSDFALEGIHEKISLFHSLAVHTAGSVSKSVFKKVSTNYGVLYPLQSLRANTEILPEIPFLIDGNNPESLLQIQTFAHTISDRVEHADDLQRLKLHVAAVISSNFANHLYALAEEFCEAEKVDFNLLHPLILETASRVTDYSPKTLQTGPAIRNDVPTMRKHSKLLKPYPVLRRIYNQISESIHDFYKSNPNSY